MNFADLMAVMTLLMCPTAAGCAALADKAGWITILYVALGAGVGYACAHGVGRLAYWLLAVDCSTKAWLQWPMLIAYIIFPAIAMTGAVLGTGLLIDCLIRYI
jgi:hypothetical protein